MHSPGPLRLQLPSHRVIVMRGREGLGVARTRRRAAPLFSEMVELVTSGDVDLTSDGRTLRVLDLELRDFHALRAIATRVGWLEEDSVEITCRNCDAPISHKPCAALELGPFIDSELDDDELDSTLDLSLPHPIPPVEIAGGRASDVSFTQVAVAAATPLHRALRSKRLRLSPRIVRAMGIASLGSERAPDRIADALGRCSNEAWDAIAELFLATHYPRRLCSIALCPRCGARNDVEAPFEREFSPACTEPPSNAQLFPGFDTFDARARALYERIVADRDPTVALVVDSEIPACDVGGEPLLAGYVPPGGDVSAPVGRAEITLYYRSFAATWREDGPYDWSAELEETLHHELAHHAAWRTGHDSMDDEERDEIARTREVLVGRAAVRRASVAALAIDIRDFLIHSWPIWLIIVAWAVAISVCGR
jgi:hypothetical protein